MAKGYWHSLGQWHEYETSHTPECAYCNSAKDVAMSHMRDASLKKAKYTQKDGFDATHTANVVRMAKGTRPVITKAQGSGGPVTITVPGVVGYQDPYESKYSVRMSGVPFGSTPGMTPGTYTLQADKPEIDMSDKGLNRYVNTASPNETKLITEVMNLRIKLSRQRDVVLDMTEAEAALVLDLLAGEVDDATAEADNHYQNGSGFEGECAEARQRVTAAEALEDRLRDNLSKALDKVYSGGAEE